VAVAVVAVVALPAAPCARECLSGL